MSNKNIMLVDATNAYIRAYIVDPSTSRNSGNPIGGIMGILKITQKLLTDYKPDRVYFCWDGRGSSKKRREINKNYKEGRKTIKLNRETGLTEEDELKNKIWQQVRAIDYINTLPISQIMIDGVEADDIISVLCHTERHKDDIRIIVSADKDFIQLVDSNTTLVRPVQKDFFDVSNTLSKFNIHPRNFALARALVGDVSDNLPGVSGLGMITVAKRFPMLSEDKDVYITDILNHCNDPLSVQKIYKDIPLVENTIKDNYKIMQLSSPSLSSEAHEIIQDCVDNYPYSFNKTLLKMSMIQDGFPFWNFDNLYTYCNKIIANKE